MVLVSALDTSDGTYKDAHINAFQVIFSKEIGGGYYWVDCVGGRRIRCVGSYKVFISRMNVILKGGSK